MKLVSLHVTQLELQLLRRIPIPSSRTQSDHSADPLTYIAILADPGVVVLQDFAFSS